MNNSKPYPKYKDSGVEWLGEIPASWELRRLGASFQERRTKVSDKDFAPLSVTKQGILPQLDTAAKTNDGDNRKLVRKGDFVINSRSDRKGSSGLAMKDGSVSLINIVMEPLGVYPPFCNYLLKGNAFIEEFYRNGHGIVADLWTTRYDEMKNIKIGMPSEDEQIAIANFLDDKVGKIDEAIAQKEQLIQFLIESKRITIHNAVTKGLNPKAPMRDSGNEWIGEIPAHWEVEKLGTSLSPISIKNHADKPLLSITRERGVILRDIEDQESNHNFIPDDLSGYKLIQKGQFGMNKMKAWQGSYGISDYTGIVSPAYFIFDFTRDVYPDFFHKAIRSKLYVSFFGAASDGVRIGQWDLSRSRMKLIPFILPPRAEQESICLHIDKEISKLSSGVTQAEQSIEKLKEYKATLINSAVTGKINVSNYGL